MPWYLDIPIMIGVSLIIMNLINRKRESLLTDPLRTKDSYAIPFETLLDLEKNSVISPILDTPDLRSVKRALSPSKLKEEDYSFILLGTCIFLFFGYLLIGLLLEEYTPLQNITVFIPVAFSLYYFPMRNLKKKFKTAKEIVSELVIESPDEFIQFGKFVKNPFDFKTTVDNFKYVESEMEKKKIERDNAQRYANEFPLLENKNMAKRVNKEFEIRVSELNIRFGLLRENVLTNNPPDVIKSIIHGNSKRTVAVTIVPHYISTLEDIVKNESLPDEIREEAQQSIDKYYKKKEENKNEKLITDAQIEIETANQMIEST